MASTLTPNLGLFKPTPNTNEPYNLTAENANKDALDALVPITFVANAAARLAISTFLFGGRVVFQRDTGQFWIYDLANTVWTQASYTPAQANSTIQEMTTAQRNALQTANIPEGATIYNITTGYLEIFRAGAIQKWYGVQLQFTYDPNYTGPVGITGTPATPVTINTVNSSVPFAFSNSRNIDQTQNGVLWTCYAVTGGQTTTPISLSYSTDQGKTWTTVSNFPTQSGSGNGYDAHPALFIDLDDYAHLIWKDTNTGYIIYFRGTPNTARTAYTWSAPTVIANGSTAFDFSDIVAHRDPATSGAWVAHVVYAQTTGSNNLAWYQRINIAANGAVTVSGSTQLGGGYSQSVPTYPSIDFRHTGDAKTVATVSGVLQPDLFISWSAGTSGSGYGIRFKKATYNSGAWTFGSEREIDNTRYSAGTNYQLLCMWDGTRIAMAGQLYSGSNASIVEYDRDAGDSTTTTNVLMATTSTTDSVYYPSATYDAAGNIWLAGAKNDNTANHLYKWTRSTNTLSAKTVIDTTSSSGNASCSSFRRGRIGTASNDRLDLVYNVGTASPYTLKSMAIN